MAIVVYWIDPGLGLIPHCEQFDSGKMTEALAFTNDLRKRGMRHVDISSEMEDCVSKPGVDAVVDGKTPDGVDYEWTKKHRGSGPLPDGTPRTLN